MIPFNKSTLVGRELEYISQTVGLGCISGEGSFGRKCESLIKDIIQAPCAEVILTPSCTAALEMTALLLDLAPGDEVIVPSFTFVTTASAYALRGATLKFADCDPLTLNIRVDEIERLLTPRTKAVVVVHYGGYPCDMPALKALSHRHGFSLIEDAAHSLGSLYENVPLGTWGDFATFSFHETKNVSCGEGGALVVNNPKYFERAHILKDKGTNRRNFQRGSVQFYEWVDLGSSFVTSDLLGAYLYAQLEIAHQINQKRTLLWQTYQDRLTKVVASGAIETAAYNNDHRHVGHLFYFLAKTPALRDRYKKDLAARGITAVSHYQPLHLSRFAVAHWIPERLPVVESAAQRLLRLPMFYTLSLNEAEIIADTLSFIVTQ